MTSYDTSDFDDIRPYTDEEIPAAMKRIVNNRFFPLLAPYVYPDRSLSDVREPAVDV